MRDCVLCVIFLLLVNKPESVNHITAAGAILPGVWAYTALRYQGHITAGDTVLICDGATVMTLNNHCINVCLNNLKN